MIPTAGQKDPDATIVALFKNHATLNEHRSVAMKRPQYDDVEVVELRYPGSRNVGVYPATAVSHWDVNENGHQVPITYAERFSRQYRQFKAQQAQTLSGTPLDYGSFLTEARRAELRAQNIYTIEALAAVDGQELKNLGPGGRDMKNRATEYLATTTADGGSGATAALKVQVEALAAQNAILLEDVARLRESKGVDVQPENFDAMSIEQLRAYVENVTGHPPIGAVNKRTLVKMAERASKEMGRAA